MIVNGGVVCGRSGNGYDRLRSIFFLRQAILCQWSVRIFVFGCELPCRGCYQLEVARDFDG